ncbi:hypothetical protein AWB71_06021 [Caballeronia peredens]|nr:hypothetical protein AWB71_06021 [Caballeronia peredens]
MFKSTQRKDPRQVMLDERALELAMFMRWCERCGAGPISSARCAEVAELILARDNIDAEPAEALYVATVASAVPTYNADKARSMTGFDGKVKSFCDQLGIDLPYKRTNPLSRPSVKAQPAKGQPDPRDQIPIGEDLKLAFARLKEAEYFRSELQYQIQFILPTLSDVMAGKAGYACAVKLLTFQYGRYSRSHWEANIVNMLMASDENFDADSALEVCRKVEASLIAWYGSLPVAPATKNDAPSMTSGYTHAKEPDTVYINVDAPTTNWLLTRGDDHHVVNHWMLTLFLNLGVQYGWHVPELITRNADGMTDIKIRPCHVPGHEATKLHNVLVDNLKTPKNQEEAEAMRDIQAFVKFLRGGGFSIQRPR